MDFVPIPNPQIIQNDFLDFCLGDTINLSLLNNYSKFAWFEKTRGQLSNDESIGVGESGTYYVQVESEFGCIGISNEIEANVRPDTNQIQLEATFLEDIFDIGNPVSDQSICGIVKLTNSSWKEMVINNPVLSNNTEFSIPASQLPIIVPPFGETNFEICFKSNVSGLRLDSLIIDDLCSTHVIPIDGEVRNIDREGESRCKLDLFFNAFGAQTTYVSYFGVPFPNPADSFTRLEFIEFDDLFFEQVSITATLFNSNGDAVQVAIPNINETETRDNGLLRYGFFEFDLSNLPTGIYLINVESRRETKTFSIIIKR